MSVQHETTTEQKAPAVGGVGRSALASAILRATGKETADDSQGKSAEESGAALPGDAALLLLGEPGDSAAVTPGTGEGEGDPEEVELWQFGGTDYTAEQVEESLRERETYQRFNQSVQPLIAALQQSEEASARLKTMAVTETEKRIEQLEAALKGGRLDPQSHQAAYSQLQEAQARLTILNDAVTKEATHRADTLNKARAQNAQQTVNALRRQNWNDNDILAVGNQAQSILGERFVDVMSPALMQVFKDAAELRAAKEGAAKRLKAKTTTALKTTKQPPQKPATPTATKKTFGSLVWGDRYK